MKKLLLVFLAVSLVVGMGMVMGDTQQVGGDVNGLVSFDLLNTSVDYGTLDPGATSDVQTNQIRVNENNNVDFSIDITLTANPQNLFQNLYFDLDDDVDFEDAEQLDEVLVFSILDDPLGEKTVNLDSVLKVPTGFPPVTGATGTITYTITVPVI